MPTPDLTTAKEYALAAADYNYLTFDPPAEFIPVVKFRRRHANAIMPLRATPGAACLDLFACETAHISEAHPTVVVGTGIDIELPPGYVGMVCSRSGLAAKQRLFVVNAPGIIDADYRGEIKVILGMLSADVGWPSYDPITISPGMRIAQLMVLPLPAVSFEETNLLSETERDVGGLGSTGA